MRWPRSLTRVRGGPRRRGAAVVEFAVVCPLLFLIVFGIIEYGYLFLVRQTMVNAAREGCRMAVLQSTTDYAAVDARIDEIMRAVSTTKIWTVTKDPDPPDGTVETVTVTVTLDASDVSLTGFFGNHGDGNLEGSCTMRKEGV